MTSIGKEFCYSRRMKPKDKKELVNRLMKMKKYAKKHIPVPVSQPRTVPSPEEQAKIDQRVFSESFRALSGGSQLPSGPPQDAQVDKVGPQVTGFPPDCPECNGLGYTEKDGERYVCNPCEGSGFMPKASIPEGQINGKPASLFLTGVQGIQKPSYEVENTPVKASETPTTENVFICPTCGGFFDSESILKLHQGTHVNDGKQDVPHKETPEEAELRIEERRINVAELRARRLSVRAIASLVMVSPAMVQKDIEVIKQTNLRNLVMHDKKGYTAQVVADLQMMESMIRADYMNADTNSPVRYAASSRWIATYEMMKKTFQEFGLMPKTADELNVLLGGTNVKGLPEPVLKEKLADLTQKAIALSQIIRDRPITTKEVGT